MEPALLDLTDEAYWSDSHEALRRARDQHPVAFTSTGEPVLLRHADVERMAGDPRLISNAVPMLIGVGVTSGPLLDWWRLMLTNRNGPEHDRQRALVSRAFTPRSVDRLRPRIRTLTRELVERCASDSTLDVIRDLADPLPITLMCELLGVEAAEHGAFARWSSDLGEGLASVMTAERRARAEAAVAGLSHRITQLLALRRAQPRDDLLSSLLDAADHGDERFDDDELVVLVINLIFGGHDTSRSLITVALALLLEHPKQLAALRADPSLIPSAAEEILRYEPPIGVLAREPLEDVEIAGVTLRKGQMLFLSILSANRDPEAFEAPDRFDVRRPPSRSMSFGWGPHHCLGASLARAELQEAIPALLATCGELALEGPPPRWIPFVSIRRLAEFRVRFSLA